MARTHDAKSSNNHAEHKSVADFDMTWPAHQFHPNYHGFREWLDSEAPDRPLTPPPSNTKRRLRKWKREAR